MKPHCLAGFLICLVNTAFSKASECLHFKKQCISASSGCHGVWNMFEDFCNVTGETCQMKDSSRCNVAIKYLADRYPNFKDCFCMEIFDCDIKRSLVEACYSNKGQLKSPSISDIQPGLIASEIINEETLSNEMENDCSQAKRICQESSRCFTMYENFQRTCRTEREHCDQTYCLTIWDELKKTTLGTCKCQKPITDKCMHVFKSIHNNTCLKNTQQHYNFESNEDNGNSNTDTHASNKNTQTSLEWEKSSLSKQKDTSIRSCFEVTAMCISDPQCNRKLASQLADCSKEAKRSCNRNLCLASIRSFYESMPFNVAQLFALCDCNEADTLCEEAKRAFHSKPCAVYRYPIPSCLQKIQSCLVDTLCRQRYEAFMSKCWGHSAICHGDEMCLYEVSRNHHNCSGDDDCKVAYINTLGTFLQEQCTCINVSESEQHLCKMVHYRLQRKACFAQTPVPVLNIVPSQKGASETEITFTGFRSPLNGAMIYIIAYTSGIILTLGIIMLILLKAR
ncbi:GDNF family receptor alpha-like [Lissotriton helveticus]